MKIKEYKYYVGDFETTVFDGQKTTEVWASACVEMFTEDVKIFHSIEEQFEYLAELPYNIIIYYHNLKFDGSFWLSYFMLSSKFTQAIYKTGVRDIDVQFKKDKFMQNNTFKYSISDMGQWYSIIIKVKNKFIEIRDSLKLLPFSVQQIGKSFKTKHQKLNMEYKGFRYAGCVITEEEQKYIANDVLVVKEALEILFNEDHKQLTIGSCCLHEYKRIKGKKNFEELYPDMTIEKTYDGCDCATADEWIRKSYKGGWCYLVPEKANKVFTNGCTADVNSLYPSMMHSDSGNKYPIGSPTWWTGNYIPEETKDKYFFVRIKTRFKVKDGMLPFIQIKNNVLYRSNECLTTSDIYMDGKYYDYYTDWDGEIKTAYVYLTLTMTDYQLFLEHYDTSYLEIIDGCYFDCKIGLFDTYINKYKKIKVESKGAKRELAKLFLNNLYGKMASSRKSNFKVAYVKDDKSLGFFTVLENKKKAGFIPVGSAITSYARNFTIRSAQKNYYGANKRGFIYADTDSIHCDLSPNEIKGITIHDTDFCCWKIESEWETGIFVRQKTYIERVNDGKTDYMIKCAGMPERCKKLVQCRLENSTIETKDEEEQTFISTPMQLTDFKQGLKVPSKLLPKRIKGGIVLLDTNYEMR